MKAFTFIFCLIALLTVKTALAQCPLEDPIPTTYGVQQCPPGIPLAQGSFQAVPLSDFISSTPKYLGVFSGGLYGNNSSQDPAGHVGDGTAAAQAIVPRDTNGTVDPTNGAIVFLTIGNSNCDIESCGGNANWHNDPGQPCATACPNPIFDQSQVPAWNESASFMAQAYSARKASGTPLLNPKVAIFDGAWGAQTLDKWDPFRGAYADQKNYCTLLGNKEYDAWCNYDRVMGQLSDNGYSEKQVQAIWLKSADSYPQCSLESKYCSPGFTQPADAYQSETYMGDIIRAIYQRYPNIKQVYISSRIYGGYAQNPPGKLDGCLSPEPFAYEEGFSVQWLVTSQINQEGGQAGDDFGGALNYTTVNGKPPVAPWIDWGPYIWAYETPRNDGLNWCNGQGDQYCSKQQLDFRYGDTSSPGDFTHPTTSAEGKVGTWLLNFMSNQQYAPAFTWFVNPLP